MRKYVKKAVCIFIVVLVLAVSFPLSAFAVDPVSASVMADAFAQAITAYGASHGVSLVFDGLDSGNTEQIGQSIHDLWARYRADQLTTDDYLDIAANVWPGLYNKVTEGAAAYVGLSVAAEYVAEMDCFWNWLLSGPAEMVRVDNAYQWNDENGVVITPIVTSVLSGFPGQPLPYDTGNTDLKRYEGGKSVYKLSSSNYDVRACVLTSTEISMYAFYCSSDARIYVTTGQLNGASVGFVSRTGSSSYSMSRVSSTGFTYSETLEYGYKDVSSIGELYIPTFSTKEDGFDYLLGYISDGTGSITTKVAPYIGDTVPGEITIPDNTDVNYEPLPWTGGVNIPWWDLIFGDGTSLTDAIRQAIADALNNLIVDDGSVVLAGDRAIDDPSEDDNTDDPPSNDPGDYAVVGLQTVFPFCIPFDIYNFLSALVATPTAPHFTATLDFPDAIGGEQTIDIDFDNPTFNQLAQLLRLLELLAFIVGLALLTRSMFIRG